MVDERQVTALTLQTHTTTAREHIQTTYNTNIQSYIILVIFNYIINLLNIAIRNSFGVRVDVINEKQILEFGLHLK